MLNKIKKYLILIFLVLLTACNKEKIIYEGDWKTTYRVYYAVGTYDEKTIYTEKEVYTCSFNGTNYLIEKDNPEELVSTTAPIRIIESKKLEK